MHALDLRNLIHTVRSADSFVIILNSLLKAVDDFVRFSDNSESGIGSLWLGYVDWCKNDVK